MLNLSHSEKSLCIANGHFFLFIILTRGWYLYGICLAGGWAGLEAGRWRIVE